MKNIRETLKNEKQTHLLHFFDELSIAQKENLEKQINEIDFALLDHLKQPADLSGAGRDIQPIKGLDLTEIKERESIFRAIGKTAIKQGKVACVLLAGGQGTRLGSDAPKGAYDIGETKPLYIFEQQICNLLSVADECEAYPPLYVMTSEKNDLETRKFWASHNYFGYPQSQIAFFKQEMAPAVDFDGKIYLEDKDKIALSPNGNGGWFTSLMEAGLDKDLAKRGVEWLNVYAVDNVLQRMADPVFVGATIESGAHCGAKAVRKAYPEEKVGALCLADGKPAIIEYYELTESMANARDEKGELVYRYGVILNYLFRLEKLREIAKRPIPVHVVKKKISYIDEQGNFQKPTTENGYKFETLIIDLIELMERVLPFEVEREKEFAPIKNKTGIDSVESARELLKKNGVTL